MIQKHSKYLALQSWSFIWTVAVPTASKTIICCVTVPTSRDSGLNRLMFPQQQQHTDTRSQSLQLNSQHNCFYHSQIFHPPSTMATDNEDFTVKECKRRDRKPGNVCSLFINILALFLAHRAS